RLPGVPRLMYSDCPADFRRRVIAAGSDAPLEIEFPVRYAQLSDVLRRLQAAGRTPADEGHFHSTAAGGSSAARRVRQLVQQVAKFDTSVLVLGESGSGKELVAQGVHAH